MDLFGVVHAEDPLGPADPGGLVPAPRPGFTLGVELGARRWQRIGGEAGRTRSSRVSVPADRASGASLLTLRARGP